jgi:hypothetical protein
MYKFDRTRGKLPVLYAPLKNFAQYLAEVCRLLLLCWPLDAVVHDRGERKAGHGFPNLEDRLRIQDFYEEEAPTTDGIRCRQSRHYENTNSHSNSCLRHLYPCGRRNRQA